MSRWHISRVDISKEYFSSASGIKRLEQIATWVCLCDAACASGLSALLVPYDVLAISWGQFACRCALGARSSRSVSEGSKGGQDVLAGRI